MYKNCSTNVIKGVKMNKELLTKTAFSALLAFSVAACSGKKDDNNNVAPPANSSIDADAVITANDNNWGVNIYDVSTDTSFYIEYTGGTYKITELEQGASTDPDNTVTVNDSDWNVAVESPQGQTIINAPDDSGNVIVNDVNGNDIAITMQDEEVATTNDEIWNVNLQIGENQYILISNINGQVSATYTDTADETAPMVEINSSNWNVKITTPNGNVYNISNSDAEDQILVTNPDQSVETIEIVEDTGIPFIDISEAKWACDAVPAASYVVDAENEAGEKTPYLAYRVNGDELLPMSSNDEFNKCINENMAEYVYSDIADYTITIIDPENTPDFNVLTAEIRNISGQQLINAGFFYDSDGNNYGDGKYISVILEGSNSGVEALIIDGNYSVNHYKSNLYLINPTQSPKGLSTEQPDIETINNSLYMIRMVAPLPEESPAPQAITVQVVPIDPETVGTTAANNIRSNNTGEEWAKTLSKSIKSPKAQSPNQAGTTYAPSITILRQL